MNGFSISNSSQDEFSQSDYIYFKLHSPLNNNNNSVIKIYKNQTLSQLYESIYCKLFPEFSTYNSDIVDFTSNNIITVSDIIPQFVNERPSIIDIFISSDTKRDSLKSIPNHRFITISEFIRINKIYFENSSMWSSSPKYVICVLNNKLFNFIRNNDEETINSVIRLESRKQNIFYRFLCSYY